MNAKWYLSYNRSISAKWGDEIETVETPLSALDEDDAIAEAKAKLSRITAEFDKEFEERVRANPTSHFAKRVASHPHVILRISL